MSARVSSRSAVMRARRRGRLRLSATLALVLAVIVGIALTAKVRREHSLPLADESIIRHQAQEKHLDPALVAAVIYAETKFDPRESSAGAQGLMQILPSTAEYLAKITHGTTFTVSDLANPEVNIAYGSYYLSYLLQHYGGSQLPAIAAYNAGLTNVDQWSARAKAQGRQLGLGDIPFPQTRAYVSKVLSAESTYSHFYAKQLGLQ
jgi:soluble lytic murein transglycosylase